MYTGELSSDDDEGNVKQLQEQERWKTYFRLRQYLLLRIIYSSCQHHGSFVYGSVCLSGCMVFSFISLSRKGVVVGTLCWPVIAETRLSPVA